MELQYTCYHFTIQPTYPGAEILLAELAELPFESFEETDNGLKAYIQTPQIYEDMLDAVEILKNEAFEISYAIEEIEQVNWNEEWEKNFDPIYVDEICCIRAPFHESSGFKYEIVIEPKMSFGTGHHETTYMMVQHLLNMDLKDKRVLDMGCGTAILAILAEKMGAAEIVGIDIDRWCYENSIENCQRNACKNFEILEGDVQVLSQIHQPFDVIIANINRNILLEDMTHYVSKLKTGGVILFSGFYTEDIPFIQEEAEQCGLTKIDGLERNRWVALRFEKK